MSGEVIRAAAAAGAVMAARIAAQVDANELEVRTISRLEALVRHGYKFIDITVRKDGQEHHFEGDWIARLFDPPASRENPNG